MAGCALGFAVVAGFLVDSLGSDAVGGAVMGGDSLFFFHFRDGFQGFFFVFDGDEGGQEDGFLDFQFFLEGRPWGGVWDEHGFHSFSFDCTMGEAELGEGENNKTLQPQLRCVGINPIHREAVPPSPSGKASLKPYDRTSPVEMHLFENHTTKANALRKCNSSAPYTNI